MASLWQMEVVVGPKLHCGRLDRDLHTSRCFGLSPMFVSHKSILRIVLFASVSFTHFWATKPLVFNTRALEVQPAHSLHSCTDILKSSGRFVDSQLFVQQMSFCALVRVNKHNLLAPFLGMQGLL